MKTDRSDRVLPTLRQVVLRFALGLPWLASATLLEPFSSKVYGQVVET